MIEKSEDTEFGCEEYCEPIHTDCLKEEKEEDRCEEKLKDCISFCQFA